MTDQDKRLMELTKQATESYEALADEMGVQGIPQWMLSDAMIQAQARDDYRWQLRLDAAERRVKELQAAIDEQRESPETGHDY